MTRCSLFGGTFPTSIPTANVTLDAKHGFESVGQSLESVAHLFDGYGDDLAGWKDAAEAREELRRGGAGPEGNTETDGLDLFEDGWHTAGFCIPPARNTLTNIFVSKAHYNSLKRIERRIPLEELGAAEQRAADGESGEAGRGEEGEVGEAKAAGGWPP